jgi:hypothetical protein
MELISIISLIIAAGFCAQVRVRCGTFELDCLVNSQGTTDRAVLD